MASCDILGTVKENDRLTTPQTTVSRVRWKSIALPPEHGSWGFLLEPILLGLLVAPSLAGVMMALAVLGAFLMRHPLKIAFTDWRRGKRYARTKTAEQFIAGYGLLALVGLVGAITLAGIRRCWWFPLLYCNCSVMCVTKGAMCFPNWPEPVQLLSPSHA